LDFYLAVFIEFLIAPVIGHIAGTICLRFCLFPMVILGQRNAAEMHNHMPTIQRLQLRMLEARKAGDVKASRFISVLFLLMIAAGW